MKCSIVVINWFNIVIKIIFPIYHSDKFLCENIIIIIINNNNTF